MKNIDIKSIIIGALLTSTIFLGVAATSKDDAGKWDDKQAWAWKSVEVKHQNDEGYLKIHIKYAVLAGKTPEEAEKELRDKWNTVGWEPWAIQGGNILYRKRIK